MGVAFKNQVGMDLIGDYHDIMACANLPQSLQLLPSPDHSAGVVWTAENQHAGVPVNDSLQVFKIEMIPAPFEFQGILCDHPSRSGDAFKEGKIDRRLENHLFSGLGKGHHSHRDRRDHSRGEGDPPFGECGAIALFNPMDDAAVKTLPTEGIPEHLMFQPLPDGLHDEVRGGKVGIGHP